MDGPVLWVRAAYRVPVSDGHTLAGVGKATGGSWDLISPVVVSPDRKRVMIATSRDRSVTGRRLATERDTDPAE
jgi:hypothetical protein